MFPLQVSPDCERLFRERSYREAKQENFDSAVNENGESFACRYHQICVILSRRETE